MNQDRRFALLEVVESLEEAIYNISDIKDEEEDALYSLPDSLQDSVRGEAMQDAIDTMENFIDLIDQIRTKIEQFAQPKKKHRK